MWLFWPSVFLNLYTSDQTATKCGLMSLNVSFGPQRFPNGTAPPNSTTPVISLLQSIPHVTKWIFRYSKMNIISLTFRIKPSLFTQVSKALRKLFLAYSPISSLFSLLTCGQILCFLTCPSHSTLRALYKLFLLQRMSFPLTFLPGPFSCYSKYSTAIRYQLGLPEFLSLKEPPSNSLP